MPDRINYDGAMNGFNVDEAREFLEALKNEDPSPRDTMKRVVMELWPVISELVDRGYTRKQVYDLLKERFDISVSYGTFRSYLYQAERERRERDGKGSKKRSDIESGDHGNADA